MILTSTISVPVQDAIVSQKHSELVQIVKGINFLRPTQQPDSPLDAAVHGVEEAAQCCSADLVSWTWTWTYRAVLVLAAWPELRQGTPERQ